jgi:DNA-binding CsgD family transcriptional regulator
MHWKSARRRWKLGEISAQSADFNTFTNVSLGGLVGTVISLVVTSLIGAVVTTELLAESFRIARYGDPDIAWHHLEQLASAGVPVRLLGRLAEAGVHDEVDPTARRPEWMKVRARFDEEYLGLKKLVRDLDLHTVCEEAGCPNIYECWEEREATFLILGSRCTRRCGFCDVMTARPDPVDEQEPRRIAEAVRAMGLRHVVLTGVARDDLSDGGARIWAAAAIYAVGSVNFLFDRTQRPHLTGDDLSELTGVPKSTLTNKAKLIRDVLRIGQMEPEFCRRELLATGARPRRTALTGPDALTSAERRVADLAADGLSNRQIAQHLFITQPTVETHLRHAFHKLGITSRAELPAQLERELPGVTGLPA